jgi:hypothetical protein
VNAICRWHLCDQRKAYAKLRYVLPTFEEIHTHFLFLSGTPCARCRTLEPDGNPTGVATEASVVEVLHSDAPRVEGAELNCRMLVVQCASA